MLLLVVSGNIQPALAQAAAQQQPAAGASFSTPAQQPAGAVQNDLPQMPAPKPVGPLYLRDTSIDYTHPHGWIPNPLKIYAPTSVPAARLGNTPRLDQLMQDGKIYLSLSDAVLLALENNFDLAIARINLDIADTDILRAKAGAGLRGVSTGLVTGTQGGVGTTVGRRRWTGRHIEWCGRRRHGREWPGAEHQWRRTCAGDSGPCADGDAAV